MPSSSRTLDCLLFRLYLHIIYKLLRYHETLNAGGNVIVDCYLQQCLANLNISGSVVLAPANMDIQLWTAVDGARVWQYPASYVISSQHLVFTG